MDCAGRSTDSGTLSLGTPHCEGCTLETVCWKIPRSPSLPPVSFVERRCPMRALTVPYSILVAIVLVLAGFGAAHLLQDATDAYVDTHRPCQSETY
jgi:hypothetical protein